MEKNETELKWGPHHSSEEQKRAAEVVAERLRKEGMVLHPVPLRGNAIAWSFWGQSWCNSLERYSDYANRLPRGRTYLRNGSVVDLVIGAGEINALVNGSELYTVRITIDPVPRNQWLAILHDCSGAVDSLVELLQGKFSRAVMDRICARKIGLFPAPWEMKFHCTCLDRALMCKHVAAALYGVGARLDAEPQLFFSLRGVDGSELIAAAGADLAIANKKPKSSKYLYGTDLSLLFGIEIADVEFAVTPEAENHNKAQAASKNPAKKKRYIHFAKKKNHKSKVDESVDPRQPGPTPLVEQIPGPKLIPSKIETQPPTVKPTPPVRRRPKANPQRKIVSTAPVRIPKKPSE